MALIAACPGKDAGETDPQGASSSSGASETGTAATEVPGPTEAAGDETVGDETVGDATVGDATVGDATVGDATVGDATVGDETVGDTGQAFPGECVETDPAVSAAFTIDLSAWPIDPMNHFFEGVPCVVDGVVSEGDTVSTALTCMHEGLPVAATLVLAAAPEGEVAWAAADAVKLSSSRWVDGDVGDEGRDVQLRGSDDSLLMSGIDEINGDAVEGRFLPLKLTFDNVCAAELDAEYPVRIEFSAQGQAPVAIFSGHRAALPIDGAAVFAIDVEKAVSNGLHDVEFKVLLRRVATGG